MSKFRFGPGALVAAAFIGPGTVTTATVAGGYYGYALFWGILLSTVVTIILQEMAARLGVVGRRSLGAALREKLSRGLPFTSVAVLVIAAIFVGNSAYEGGNLRGAILGLETIPQLEIDPALAVLLLSILAGLILYSGRLGAIQAVLGGIVVLMSMVYTYAAFSSGGAWTEALIGMLPLRLPSKSELTLVALIGTTVVPYNLFLHASAAQKHYASPSQLPMARKDAIFSILIGGFVTLAISFVSAAAFSQLRASGESFLIDASQLVVPLKASIGSPAPYLIGVGYFAAGFSSAITAPLAAAYAVCGLFGWSADLKSTRFRVSWMVVLGAGLLFTLTKIKPVPLILLAQLTNGLLLPIIAGLLLWIVNDAKLLGKAKNSVRLNIAGIAVLLVTLILAFRTLWLLYQNS